ncbi:hypothetical protein J22TS1_48040 [Siminovitchia terrae]|nr:hypothetical protein J22TS1_48040 [Siminovitchia terrae]
MTPKKGDLKVAGFAGSIPIRKETYETGFWIMSTDLIIELNKEEYVFQVASENEAEIALAWQKDFKNRWEKTSLYMDEGLSELDWNEDEDEDYINHHAEGEPLLIMSCTYCYKR